MELTIIPDARKSDVGRPLQDTRFPPSSLDYALFVPSKYNPFLLVHGWQVRQDQLTAYLELYANRVSRIRFQRQNLQYATSPVLNISSNGQGVDLEELGIFSRSDILTESYYSPHQLPDNFSFEASSVIFWRANVKRFLEGQISSRHLTYGGPAQHSKGSRPNSSQGNPEVSQQFLTLA